MEKRREKRLTGLTEEIEKEKSEGKKKKNIKDKRREER